jgi:hypothetical protein
MRRASWIMVGFLVGLLASAYADDPRQPFTAHLNNIKSLGSTVPGIGDQNPYGVAIVPRSTGGLEANSILVSNFNNSSNLQGTGTTIVQVAHEGGAKLFAQIPASAVPECTGGVGLTTALAVLQTGWVIVGSLPTTDGMSDTVQPGCLIVLNSQGQPVETLTNGINGPWDMTVLDGGSAAVLFVSNVLDGTVVRIAVTVSDIQMPQQVGPTVTIGSGFPVKFDPNALVIGPTGLGLGVDGTLYVADTLGNRIAAIPNALRRTNGVGPGTTVSQGGALNGPLGLAITSNGDILTVNSGDGNMVETTPGGSQVKVKMVDVTGIGGGTLFGLAIAPVGNGVNFVNDGNNMLYLLH